VSLGKESQICNVRQQISTLAVFTSQFPVSLVSRGKITQNLIEWKIKGRDIWKLNYSKNKKQIFVTNIRYILDSA